MSRELDFLAREAVRGRLTRREFVGRAAAFGLTLAGGDEAAVVDRAGAGAAEGRRSPLSAWSAASSTNSLDPALQLTQVPQIFTKCWGETLVYRGAGGQLAEADAGGIVGGIRRREDMDASRSARA